MPKIHWLRQNQRPSAATVAAEKPWEWCDAHLGTLKYLTPLGRPPSVRRQNEERPDLAPFRGNEYVVVELREQVGVYKPGFYFANLSPQQLQEKMKSGK